ncbi:MAG TPA: TIM barrel protein [Acidobacteriaceae bacterium]|nr:TIM barrel protein [Acidobacteriaceae bacterium]
MNRREFLAASLAATAVSAQPSRPEGPRFAHRQAQMPLPPGQNVFEFAAKIPGLSGVQLQMFWQGEDISQGDRARELKLQARDNGMLTPSIAGIWQHGENIFAGAVAERAINNAIRTAATLEAGVILVVMFKENCPDMSDPKSYGPVVELFRRMAPRAADAHTKLCVETSLLPEHDRKLIEMVNHPAFRVYFDATNVETYHPGSSLSGILTLRNYIGEVHLKNGDRLLNQEPAKVNWAEAIREFRVIHYNHWYCFETEHASPERCIADTVANMAFVRQQLSSHA